MRHRTHWLRASLTFACAAVVAVWVASCESGDETALPAGTGGHDAGKSDGPGKAGTSSGCKPITCGSASVECGKAPDGCGATIDCPACPQGTFCGGAGPNHCGSEPCVAKSCQPQQCGPVSDGCAAVINCPDCPAGQKCKQSVCQDTAAGGAGGDPGTGGGPSGAGGVSGEGGTGTGGTGVAGEGGTGASGEGGTGVGGSGGQGGSGGGCVGAKEACTTGDECCGGYCLAGLCCVLTAWSGCNAASDCCENGTLCESQKCCVPPGNQCANDGECCSGQCDPGPTACY